MPWQPPSLTVQWGPYSKPDGEEQQQIVTATMALLGKEGARIATRELVLEKLRTAGVLDFESIEAVTKALDEEQDAADEKARENAKNQLVDASTVEVETEKKRARIPGAKPPGA